MNKDITEIDNVTKNVKSPSKKSPKKKGRKSFKEIELIRASNPDKIISEYTQQSNILTNLFETQFIYKTDTNTTLSAYNTEDTKKIESTKEFVTISEDDIIQDVETFMDTDNLFFNKKIYVDILSYMNENNYNISFTILILNYIEHYKDITKANTHFLSTITSKNFINLYLEILSYNEKILSSDRLNISEKNLIPYNVKKFLYTFYYYLNEVNEFSVLFN